jgi:hypothetical protein
MNSISLKVHRARRSGSAAYQVLADQTEIDLCAQ